MSSVELSTYDNSWYKPGGGRLKRLMWYIVNASIFDSWWCPHAGIKTTLLRWFGASVGVGVVIKPRVNIKYPWHLCVGNYVWIGEGVWIDNLARIAIGDNVCISQGAYLLTGNHDYSDRRFGLIVRGITLENCSWVGARAIICPGVIVGNSAVITGGSVLKKDATPHTIYQGHPAQPIRVRTIK